MDFGVNVKRWVFIKSNGVYSFLTCEFLDPLGKCGDLF
jgi:hypothetical protein